MLIRIVCFSCTEKTKNTFESLSLLYSQIRVIAPTHAAPLNQNIFKRFNDLNDINMGEEGEKARGESTEQQERRKDSVRKRFRTPVHTDIICNKMNSLSNGSPRFGRLQHYLDFSLAFLLAQIQNNKTFLPRQFSSLAHSHHNAEKIKKKKLTKFE